jgi:hypothetical protein
VRSHDSHDPKPDEAPEELFAEIASWTGMPFPNLVYRTLAEQPGRLEACWSRLRPGLALGGVDDVRAALLAPSTPSGANQIERRTTPPLGSDARADLVVVLDTYDSGNSCNAVLVRLLLDGAPGREATSPRRNIDAPGPARTTLPPMTAVADMTPAARDIVMSLSRIVDPTGAVVPSLFRHLAHDVSLLGAVNDVLSAADSDGELDRRSSAMAARADAAAERWPSSVAPLEDADARALLEPFRRAIPRMLAVSGLVRTGLLGR